MAENNNNQQPVADEQPVSTPKYNPNERLWKRPKVRGKQYAEERKMGVHTQGKKKGEELSEYDKGVRSGYLQCQSDHTGIYTYATVAKETEGPDAVKIDAARTASRDKHYWAKRRAAQQNKDNK